MNEYQVLWTGGYDSTYRVLELAREECYVNLIYCRDEDRKTTELELSAMQTILAFLRNDKRTKATFSDIKIIDVKDIPENYVITEAYKKISREIRIGSQYEWLGRLAFIYPGLELGMQKHIGQFGGCSGTINKFGAYKFDGIIGYVDQEKSTKECNAVFGNFRFPIMTKTEKDMLSDIKSWGYIDVISMIWFCHSPIDGEPCGICSPCQQKMEDDMIFLFSEKARKRYAVISKIKKIIGIKATMKLVAVYIKMFCRQSSI